MKTYFVDAFTAEKFKGNPAAVCMPHENLTTDTMQKIAAEKGIPRATLTREIDNTIRIINQTFDHLNESFLKKEYPVLVFENSTSTEYLLVHLATHLSYHLGQVNYHRRLVANENIIH